VRVFSVSMTATPERDVAVYSPVEQTRMMGAPPRCELLELSATSRTPSVAKTLRIFFAALVAVKWFGCWAWRHRLAPSGV